MACKKQKQANTPLWNGEDKVGECHLGAVCLDIGIGTWTCDRLVAVVLIASRIICCCGLSIALWAGSGCHVVRLLLLWESVLGTVYEQACLEGLCLLMLIKFVRTVNTENS